MQHFSLYDLSQQLKNKTVSSAELTSFFLQRIKKHDPVFNSFITLTEEKALNEAKRADIRLNNGDTHPLCGIPIAHKDIFCTQNVKTSCASKMLDNFVAPYNATIVENMAQAGMVTLGKTNMDEFAMGSSNETSFYGEVKNPWDISRVPGGSSGGSAAAVAARLAPAATATDTGGSIRQPASLCGLTGLKPTYGRVSRYGMIAFASSLDQAGTLTHDARDSAMLLQNMAGYDAHDSTSSTEAVPDYLANIEQSLEGLRIGIPKEFFGKDLDPSIQQLISDALKEYEKLGATIVEVSLPNIHLSVPTYYVIAPAEASANLSRFDGVRYGYRCSSPKDLDDLYQRSRSEAFGPEVQRRILVGSYVLSSGYYDAYFNQALKIRRLIKNDFETCLESVDIIACPCTASSAFKLNEKTSDPVKMYLEDLYTIGVNLAGLPGMSIPVGKHNNLPIGMQLIGNYFKESQLLNAAHRFQQATHWHTLTPENID
jgi:aspartyl-tRNA(Asn)/glutamyl-tRNA(Gln) amidotransferase subunit A